MPLVVADGCERDRGAFVAEISSNVTLANTFSSYSATLISLIGSLVTAKPAVVDGNGGAVTGAVKCSVLLVFALAAFLCFKVGAKILGRANFLINMPPPAAQRDYIDGVVVRGFILIEVGNRSFYFSLALATWLSGPMPMLVACLVLLVGLYIKDKHTIPLEDSDRRIELSSA